MAEMESWEAAVEFGIPESDWARYTVRSRSDDLYIACLSTAFDALRIKEIEQRETTLASIAKVLVVYSRSAAAKYLSGVEKKLNQIYSASLYYLAGFPATATVLTRKLDFHDEISDEESFLLGFLGRQIREDDTLGQSLLESVRMGLFLETSALSALLQDRVTSGLKDDPRKLIASKFALACVERFYETNVWKVLSENAAHFSYEVWRPFLESNRSFPLWEFLPSQLAAIQSGLLGDSDETFSLQMPTSSGKTALCGLLIYHEVKILDRRVLFLVPFRALAAEIRDGMARRLEDAGVKVVASHGGNIPTKSESSTVEDADVLIITPEKFIAISQTVPDLTNKYQTIICDEGHLIDDDSRGLQYELLLTKLKGTETEPKKFVFLSAILPNVNEIHEWLGGRPENLVKSEYSPVDTDYALLVPQKGKEKAWQLIVNPIDERPKSYFLYRFLIKDDFRYINPQTGRPKLIAGSGAYTSLACAAALKARRHGPVALFTTSRDKNGIRGLASKMLLHCECDTLAAQGAPDSSNNLPELIDYVQFLLGSDYLLPRLLRFGVGYHHGMLPQELRREMEEGIQEGVIDILLCTTTLAEGVNLPIRTLIVHTIRRYNSVSQQWQYLPNRTIKNIIGRAGRAGKEIRGRVLFINDSEQQQVLEILRDQKMESARGALFKLVKSINSFLQRNRIKLNNEMIDQQTDPVFLSLIDSIDFTLIELIPADTPQDEINNHIEELLEKTLAKLFCDTDVLKECLYTIFQLRATKLQESVSPETWQVLRKTGSSPRFWSLVNDSELLKNELWQELSNPLDDRWLNEIIQQVMKFPTMDMDVDPGILIEAVRDWVAGKTYKEISESCDVPVDDVLKIICHSIGYKLQDHMAKLCQLAIEHYGEDEVTEIARNWAALLQYGLSTMQQLDFFERGGSDRLGVWGITRYLTKHKINLRGNDLIFFIRKNKKEIRTALKQDNRVPNLCAIRIFRELRI